MPLFVYEAIPIIINNDGVESEDTNSKIEYIIEAIDEEAAKKSGNTLLQKTGVRTQFSLILETTVF